MANKRPRHNSDWSKGDRVEDGRNGRESSHGRNGVGRYSPHSVGYSDGKPRDRPHDRALSRAINVSF